MEYEKGEKWETYSLRRATFPFCFEKKYQRCQGIETLKEQINQAIHYFHYSISNSYFITASCTTMKIAILSCVSWEGVVEDHAHGRYDHEGLGGSSTSPLS